MNWIQRFLTAIATHKADASAHHAKLTFTPLNPNQGHANANNNAWEDWDLSGEVAAGAKYVLIYILNVNTTTVKTGGVRENGTAFDNVNTVPSPAVGSGAATDWGHAVIVPCDSNRVVETKTNDKGSIFFNCGGYFS